jgi:hypothetical protein
MGRRIRTLGLASLPLVFALALPAAPATAATAPLAATSELRAEASFSCTESEGTRVGNIIVFPQVADTGKLAAFTINPGTLTFSSPIGGDFGGTSSRNASADFTESPGPTSVTVSATVAWDTPTPHTTTLTQTFAMPACHKHPTATITSTCNGTFSVLLRNGDPTDNTEFVGGDVTFDITGAFGYHFQSALIQPKTNTAPIPVPADASPITIAADGVAIATGNYTTLCSVVQPPGGQPPVAPPPNGNPGPAPVAAPPTVTPASSPAAEPSTAASTSSTDAVGAAPAIAPAPVATRTRPLSSTGALAGLGGAAGVLLGIGGALVFWLARRRPVPAGGPDDTISLFDAPAPPSCVEPETEPLAEPLSEPPTEPGSQP